jgi:hypothetical protein
LKGEQEAEVSGTDLLLRVTKAVASVVLIFVITAKTDGGAEQTIICILAGISAVLWWSAFTAPSLPSRSAAR